MPQISRAFRPEREEAVFKNKPNQLPIDRPSRSEPNSTPSTTIIVLGNSFRYKVYVSWPPFAGARIPVSLVGSGIRAGRGKAARLSWFGNQKIGGVAQLVRAAES